VLRIALTTLRARWTSFAGTFIALTGGVGLIAAMGLVLAASVAAPPRPPVRFTTGVTVVAPPGSLTVSTAYDTKTERLAESPGLAEDLVAGVPDRTFYAQLAGVPARDPAGHGWSSARYTGYRLTTGSAPANDAEVVVTGGARPGDRVDVRTLDGTRPYTVSGVVAARGFETPVFFTDAEAARLSPRIDALITTGTADAVRASVGDRARVLTGAELGELDPGRDRDADVLNDTTALTGIAGGFAAFVAIFVVASTFGYSVVQRRREFALLRVTGATPGQVRRMLYGEAALVSVAASALGCVLGVACAPAVLDWLIQLEMAPAWLPDSHSRVPLVVAFASGVTVALSGVVVASWRAGRVRPVEALREAVLDTRAMTPGRWIAGLGTLGGALVMLGAAVADPESATSDKTYMPTVMVLVAACGLLAPAAVRPLALGLTRPLRRLPGATAVLVREHALAAVRRTATTAAPVLVTVAVTALLGGAAGTIDAAEAKLAERSVSADFLVRPVGTPGISREVVARLAALDGVDVLAPVPTTVYRVHAGAVLVAFPAQAVAAEAVPRILDVRLRSGAMSSAGDEASIVVPENWGVGAGATVDVWLADGTPATLRVTGVVAEGQFPDAYLPARYATAPAPLAYVKMRAGADPAGVQRALHAAVAGQDAQVLTHRAWAARAAGRSADASRVGLFIVLAIILGYTGLAIVNALLMASSERGTDLAALRLAGATRGQVLRILAVESLLAVSIGVALAAAATVLGLAGLWLALLRLAGPTAIVMPWLILGAVTATAAVLAVLATVLPAWWRLRRSATAVE
jgi:putative ABC transport system permease protein